MIVMAGFIFAIESEKVVLIRPLADGTTMPRPTIAEAEQMKDRCPIASSPANAAEVGKNTSPLAPLPAIADEGKVGESPMVDLGKTTTPGEPQLNLGALIPPAFAWAHILIYPLNPPQIVHPRWIRPPRAKNSVCGWPKAKV